MGEAVGIMGGTFDPIHFGHLVAAEEARVRFGLGRVVFVANGEPPHKKGYPVTPAERRHEMVVLATASNPHFQASRIEVDRPGPSYAVDTLRALRAELGPGVKLYFITGVDAIAEIATWREPERLGELCEFIAVSRPGSGREGLGGQLAGRVHLLEIPGVAVSSTEVRRRAGAGESLRYLTPPAVARYIGRCELYRNRGVV